MMGDAIEIQMRTYAYLCVKYFISLHYFTPTRLHNIFNAQEHI